MARNARCEDPNWFHAILFWHLTGCPLEVAQANETGVQSLPARLWLEHYHLERNHQGLENQLLTKQATPANDNSQVIRRERLGGILSYYCRMTAPAA